MRAGDRAVATVPLAAAALAGLVVLAAPAAAVDRDGGGELAVTTDGVSFDAARRPLWGDGGGWLNYAVTALDGSHTRFLGNGFSEREAADGHLGLDVPDRGPYRDGWCVTWVNVTGLKDQFAGWAGDAPVCTTSTPSPAPEPPPAPSEPPAPAAPPPADPAPPAVEAAVPAPAAEDTAPEPEPEPSETPTPTPTETPTPTASPTPEAEDRPEPARTPLAAASERGAPPPPDETFPVLAVAGVGGLVAAAAGGVILLLRRVV